MANEYLKRTPTSTGNRRVWTWSGWVKRNILYTSNAGPYLFDAGTSGSQFNGIRFLSDSSSCLDYNNYPGSTTHAIRSEPVYRDAGSWMHVLVAINTTSNTASDRLKMYVNGSRITDFRSSTYPSINDASSFINAINTHYIGRSIEGAYRYLEGEMSDVFLVDGQALEPDVFGFYKDGDGYMSSGTTKATDFRPGQWSPRLPKSIKHTINRSGGFGVNGFYLPMNDSSNPGADFHCTPNSIIKLKGEDLPQPRNGAPTTSDSFISEVRKEIGELGFAGVVKFDGSGDYLEIPDSDDFDFGSGDFTVEAFIEGARGGSSTNSVIFNQSTGSASSNSSFYFGAGTNGISLYLSTSGSSWTNFIQCGNITSLANNGFHHVVWQRRSNTLEIYVDGILQPVTGGNASFTGTIFNSSRVVDVGRQSTSGSNFNGFISNLRVVKGTAVYTGNFTAPTEPLTNVTNTKLLCCNSSTSATAATVTPGTITANGNAFATTSELTGSIVVAVPGISGGTNSGYGDYSGDIRGSGSSKSTINDGSVAIHTFPSHYGSGMRFSGSGNSNATGGLVKINSVSDFELGLGDFTLEGWLYAHVNNQDSGVFGIGSGGSEVFLSWTQGTLKWRQSGGTLINSPSTITHDQWHHVVLQSRSQLCSLIVNGVTVGSATNTHVLTGGDFIIGSWSTSKVYGFDGDIQDVRLYKGVAKYKGGFDVSKPYTPVGIEAFRTTADTCKNNFATLNSIDNNGGVLSNGNLTYGDAGSDGWNNSRATIGVSSGKWYWEMRVDAINQVICASVAGPAGNDSTNGARLGFLPGQSDDAGVTYYDDGRLYHADSQTAGQVSWGAAYGATDIIGIALDMDDSGGKVWFSKNGSWQGAGNPSIGANPARSNLKTYADTYFPTSGTYFANTTQTFNFGQNPSFSGQVTAGTNADDSGKGLFKYYSPTGFLALCEDNLPTPAIADPGDHFKTVLYTGDGNEGHSITGVGFKPDLVWVKCRSNADDHTLSDTVRGPGLALYSNNTNQENVSSIRIQSFDDNGFTTGSSGDTNTSGRTFCAWCWKAGGAAVSNSDGDLTSQVSVNQDAGFSIVKFTGQGGSSSATVGHGLGKKPAFWIYKPHTNTTNWYMYHQSWGASGWAQFNTTAAVIGNAAAWGGVEPTSTVLTHGSGLVNQGSCILYAWAEIEGYSKFGSYTGNGNTDGPFVYCGFKPAFLLVKLSSTTNGHWVLWDSSRTPTNLTTTALSPNNSWADTNNFDVDLLSNGFKQRDTEDSLNLNGETYIFAAFAESPFQTANAK